MTENIDVSSKVSTENQRGDLKVKSFEYRKLPAFTSFIFKWSPL